ncbi:hypothetical protein KIPB_005936, partial [Kipferlia bialata]|eukprot:g5936.t1
MLCAALLSLSLSMPPSAKRPAGPIGPTGYQGSGLDRSFWKQGWPTAAALLLAMEEQSGRHWELSHNGKFIVCGSIPRGRGKAERGCPCSMGVSPKGK